MNASQFARLLEESVNTLSRRGTTEVVVIVVIAVYALAALVAVRFTLPRKRAEKAPATFFVGMPVGTPKGVAI